LLIFTEFAKRLPLTGLLVEKINKHQQRMFKTAKYTPNITGAEDVSLPPMTVCQIEAL